MADISVKMGVSGLSTFRTGMKQAQESVKTLDAELKLNAERYKATGDAETYMANKTKLLQQQIREQEKVVKNAREALAEMAKNGVDQASTSYQRMQQTLLNAETTLTGMQNNLKGVGTTAKTAATDANTLTTNLKQIGKQVNYTAVVNGIGKITEGIEKAAKNVADFAGNLWNTMRDAATWADDKMTLASMYRLDVETLQRMEKTADLIDTPVEAIVKGQQRLKNNLVYGDKEFQQVLRTLRVGIKEGGNWIQNNYTSLKLRDATDIFWDIGDALSSYGDEIERDAMAQKIFGSSWMELRPLFEAGRETYEETMGSWSTVSEENVKSLGNLDDSLQTLENEFETLKITVLSSLAPALTKVSTALTGILKEVNSYLQTDEGKEKLKALGDSVAELFKDLTSIDTGAVVEKVSGALDSIKKVLDWIEKNKDGIVTAIEAIAGAWGLSTIAKTAVSFVQGGNALKNLLRKSNTGGGSIPTTSTPSDGIAPSTDTNGVSNVATLNATTENVTTSRVTTMYVQNMVGGNNGTPSNPTNPTTPTTPSTPNFPNLQSLPGNGATPLLNAGGGNGLNGYVPVLPSGGSGLSLPGGGDINIGGGSPTVNIGGGSPQLNLPSGSDVNLSGGGSSPIRLDPNEFDVTEAGKPQLRWPEDGPPQPEKPTDNGGGGFGAAAAIFAVWGAALYGVNTGLDHLFGDAERAKDIEERENTLAKAEEAAEALGEEVQQDVEMLTRLANALGPATDEEGNYKKSVTFSTYWEPTNDLGAIIGDLGDLRKRGLLHADIEKWGKRNGLGETQVPGTGYEAWDLLRRYWGVYTTKDWDSNENPYQRHVDYPLDPQEEYALLDYLKDMYTRKIEDQMKTLEGGEDGKDAGTAITEATEKISAAAERAAQSFDGLTAKINAIEIKIPQFANGLKYVPYDGYIAALHRGERIVPANQNRNYNVYNNTYFDRTTVSGGVDADGLAARIATAQKRALSAVGS